MNILINHHGTCITAAFIFLSLSTLAQKVHSHNDYWQKRPFYEALEAGAESIEVDILLINNVLYAGHEEVEIALHRTLESLYLQPLSVEVKKGKKLRLQLLIDVKTEALSTLAALVMLLQSYPELSSPNNGVRIVISGQRPKPEAYHEYPDFIQFDHQNIDELPGDLSKVALISLPFSKYSRWTGKGEFKEKGLIKSMVDKAHNLGKPIRFWGTRDVVSVWEEWINLGIDYLNTDQPRECMEYVNKNKK